MIDTAPVSARVSPARMLISVVLPAPLGPSNPKNSPCATSRSMPSSAWTGPNAFLTPRAETAGVTVAEKRPMREPGGSREDQIIDAVELGERHHIGRHIHAADLAALFLRIALPF